MILLVHRVVVLLELMARVSMGLSHRAAFPTCFMLRWRARVVTGIMTEMGGAGLLDRIPKDEMVKKSVRRSAL